MIILSSKQSHDKSMSSLAVLKMPGFELNAPMDLIRSERKAYVCRGVSVVMRPDIENVKSCHAARNGVYSKNWERGLN